MRAASRATMREAVRETASFVVTGHDGRLLWCSGDYCGVGTTSTAPASLETPETPPRGRERLGRQLCSLSDASSGSRYVSIWGVRHSKNRQRKQNGERRTVNGKKSAEKRRAE